MMTLDRCALLGPLAGAQAQPEERILVAGLRLPASSTAQSPFGRMPSGSTIAWISPAAEATRISSVPLLPSRTSSSASPAIQSSPGSRTRTELPDAPTTFGFDGGLVSMP